ncbi:MAG: M48 family metalloprotease [bacterium]|uniref:M48 family metalloprotease n=1 Tax=Candidatus Methylomirabilis tolerans TaxID=3123416 RepID=A0AAJ1EJA4_9BACT|nr:M48 family metalloprotease [Candidatus Methylomirabilis sp.]
MIDRATVSFSLLRLIPVVIAMSLALAACGPTLKQVTLPEEAVKAERERQFELALAMMTKRHDRLQTVALPLLIAATPLCEDDAEPLYGIELHDKVFYREKLGEAFEQAAVKQYGLGDGVYVRYVHPTLPAGLSGLSVGDRVHAIDDVPLDHKQAIEAMRILRDRNRAGDPPLSLTIERKGQRMTLTIPTVRACRYPVILVNEDAVNAYADGSKVGITKGMIRFAERDEELALVVGHEIAHNTLGHLRKRVGPALLGTIADLAIAIVTGVRTGIFQEVGGRVFSQAFEAEADYAGLYLVARAGYDITGSAQFWRRMAVEHPGSIQGAFLTTHPSAPERFLAIERTSREIEEKRRQGLPLIPERRP